MRLLPGVLASVAVMLAGFWFADRIGQVILASQGLSGSSPISGVPAAIVLGLLIRNLTPFSETLTPGLRFATTTLLRAGIVLVGIRLSLFDVVRLDPALPKAGLVWSASWTLIVPRFSSVSDESTWIGLGEVSVGLLMRLPVTMIGASADASSSGGVTSCAAATVAPRNAKLVPASSTARRIVRMEPD